MRRRTIGQTLKGWSHWKPDILLLRAQLARALQSLTDWVSPRKTLDRIEDEAMRRGYGEAVKLYAPNEHPANIVNPPAAKPREREHEHKKHFLMAYGSWACACGARTFPGVSGFWKEAAVARKEKP